jgi:5-hydroxyisourate hydrolase
MSAVCRRNFLGAGASLLALAFFAQKGARAAGAPGLTTHMLDTVSGKPAEGVRIDFAALEGDTYRLIRTVHTNADGRNAEPLLTPETMKTGQFSSPSISPNTSPGLAPCCRIRRFSIKPSFSSAWRT